jgi:hypothetical protein
MRVSPKNLACRHYSKHDRKNCHPLVTQSSKSQSVGQGRLHRCDGCCSGFRLTSQAMHDDQATKQRPAACRQTTFCSRIVVGRHGVQDFAGIQPACVCRWFSKVVLLTSKIIGSVRAHRWTPRTDPAVVSYEALMPGKTSGEEWAAIIRLGRPDCGGIGRRQAASDGGMPRTREPDHNVHEGAPNSGLLHFIV